MLERESTATLKPFRVVALGGKVTLTVLATAPPSVVNDASKGFASTEAKFDVGTGTPMSCTVLGKQLNVGDFVRRLLTIPPGADGAIETAARMAGRRAYVQVTGIFVWGPKNSRTLAGPKVAVLPMSHSMLVCVHDEPGYQKTFERVAATAVKTLQPYADRPAPRYSEVQQATDGGANVGVGLIRVYDRRDGKRAEVDVMTLLFFGGGKLHSIDGAVMDVTAASGALVSESSATVQDGRLVSRLVTTRTAPDEYLVAGTLDGTRVKTRLHAKQRVMTDETRAPVLLSVANGTVATASYADLDTSDSPVKITTWTAKRLTGRKLLLSTDTDAETCLVDARGLCSVVDMTKGVGAGLVIRRVDARGTL